MAAPIRILYFVFKIFHLGTCFIGKIIVYVEVECKRNFIKRLDLSAFICYDMDV